MGLDTTHDCWHGSYRLFNKFRTELARAAGLRISEHRSVDEVPEYWQEEWDFPMATSQGIWETPPADPLLILLAHSDCDGEISPEHATLLAARLEGLIPRLPESVVDWHGAAERFAAGLRLAASVNEPVEFH